MENIKIEEWLKDNHRNSGDGYGSGYGYGDGSGSGSGSGYGYGDGDGSGYGYGSGSGSGSGYGYGYGDGDGSGYGDGYGDGSGDGCLSSFEGNWIFLIDDVPTIITYIKDSAAKGFMLNYDFSKAPCFVVKGNGYFAHGKTLKEATESLREKIFSDMDSEEAIEEFLKTFEQGKTYKVSDFFEWHHYLTGSCKMGREAFMRNKGLNFEDDMAVDEFIKLTENDYGSSIIKELKERWNDLSIK